MQFLQDGTEFCQLIYADYLDDNGSILADDTRLDATDPQMNESDWSYEYISSDGVVGYVAVGGFGGYGVAVGGFGGYGVGNVVSSIVDYSGVGGGYGSGHRVGGMGR